MGRKINFLSIFLFNLMCAAVAEGFWWDAVQPKSKKRVRIFRKTRTTKQREKSFSVVDFLHRSHRCRCLFACHKYLLNLSVDGKLEIETRTSFYVCIEQLHAITSTDTSDWVSFFRNFPPKNRRLSQQHSGTQEEKKKQNRS